MLTRMVSRRLSTTNTKIGVIISGLVVIFLCIGYGCSMRTIALPTPNSPALEVSQTERVRALETQLIQAVAKRVVIFDATFSIESPDPDSVHGQLIEMAKAYDGYILESTTTKTTIRIPSKNLYEIMDKVQELGKVIDKNVSGKDVTEKYHDLEIRLDNVQKTRKRYLQLLEKANDVSSALRIEKELERLSREIDLLKGKLNRLSHLEQFSTITVRTINSRTKPKLGPIGYVFVGVYKFFKFLFVRN